MGADAYAFGHFEHELARLKRQGDLYGPITRDVFQRAGLRPGMRVIDVDCGAGDVSLLAAEMVGPDGAVLALDRAPEALATTKARAGSRDRLDHYPCLRSRRPYRPAARLRCRGRAPRARLCAWARRAAGEPQGRARAGRDPGLRRDGHVGRRRSPDSAARRDLRALDRGDDAAGRLRAGDGLGPVRRLRRGRHRARARGVRGRRRRTGRGDHRDVRGRHPHPSAEDRRGRCRARGRDRDRYARRADPRRAGDRAAVLLHAEAGGGLGARIRRWGDRTIKRPPAEARTRMLPPPR